MRLQINSFSISGNNNFTLVRVSLFQKKGIIEKLVEDLELQMKGRFAKFDNCLIYAVEQTLVDSGFEIVRVVPEKPENPPGACEIPDIFKMPEFKTEPSL